MSPGSFIGPAEVGQALARVGIAAGDTILLHADAMAAAQFPPMPSEARLDALLLALQDHLGPAGTLVLPTFTYSFSQGQDYDPATSPSQVGILGERFRQRCGVRRSLDPLFSVAAWGARAAELTSGQASQCFGPDSFFARLHRTGGKLAFLGCSLQVATFVHYVERCLGVDYRFDKEFRGRVRQPGGQWRDATVTYYVRDLHGDSDAALMPLQRRLEDLGLLAQTSLGRVGLISVGTNDFFEQASALLASDPHALIKQGQAGQTAAGGRP